MLRTDIWKRQENFDYGHDLLLTLMTEVVAMVNSVPPSLSPAMLLTMKSSPAILQPGRFLFYTPTIEVYALLGRLILVQMDR